MLAETEGPVGAALHDLVSGGIAPRDGPRELSAEIVERVVPHLEAPDWRVRANAAWLLGLLGDPSATPALSARLSDPEGNARLAAVVGLSEIRDPAALDALSAAMRDEYEGIAREAVAGVAAIGGRKAVAALIALVGDRAVQQRVKDTAAHSLSQMTDPEGTAVAARHFGRRGVQWQRAFYCAPFLYGLALLAARRERAGGRRLWRGVLYALSMVSMLAVVGLFLFPEGAIKQTYRAALVTYPIGLLLGALFVAAALRRLGVELSITRAFVRQILACVPLMWGTVVAWYGIAWVLTVAGFILAWR